MEQHNSLFPSVQDWVRLGVIQVEQDLWTISDESWDLICCRYAVHLILLILLMRWRTVQAGLLRANPCGLFSDAGRIHLRRGARWEDHVHLRDGLGPLGPVSGATARLRLPVLALGP